MADVDDFWDPLPVTSLDWVDVTDDGYGATGDGSTDDTAAIQAAVNATPIGGVCYFPVPSSEYKITAAITVPHAMRLAGGGSFIGQYTTIRQATANTSGIVSPSGASKSFVIEGLAILGTIGGQTAGAAIETTQTVGISRCYTSGFQDGLRVTATAAAHTPYYCTVDQCYFDSATRAGVRLVGIVNNFTWIACRAVSNGTGFQIVGGPYGVRFYGGTLEDNTIGLDIDGNDATTGQDTSSVLVSGVYFEQSAGMTDIRIGNGSTVYGVRVEACPFIKPNLTGNGWHVNATNVDGLSITDCEFTSSQAVQVSTPGTGVTYGRNHNLNAGTVTLPSGTIRTDAAAVTPSAVADTAAVGTSHYLARADHVHEGATAVTTADVRDAGRWEVVVDGNPTTAVTTPDGTDWVFGWITT